MNSCPECGGNVTLLAIVGRKRRYRGEDDYIIPADLLIPTCQNCGASWMDNQQIGVLSRVFEEQRLARYHDKSS